MPIIKSAVKRARQTEKRHAKNLRVKRALREAVKAFENKPSFDGLKAVQSNLDTAVKKHILEKRTAARRMKKFSAAAKQAGVKIPAKKATPAKTAAPKTAAKKPAAKKPAAKK